MNYLILNTGLELVNFVQEDLGNTSVHVLSGEVEVHLPDNDTTRRLRENEKMQVSTIMNRDLSTCFFFVSQ